eukprot:scaffold2667_cov237-Amphora_coffeaeformis.AAC.11
MSNNEREVISLLDDDDDDDDDDDAVVVPSYNIVTRTLDDGCIEILDSDAETEDTQDEDGKKPRAKSSSSPPRNKKNKTASLDTENASPNTHNHPRTSRLRSSASAWLGSPINGSASSSSSSSHTKRKRDRTITEEVEIVAAPSRQPVVAAAAAFHHHNDDDDDDIQLVGSVGVNALVDFPHARENCVTFAFGTTIAAFQQYCANCYCYVCDIPASQCQQWQQHCRATYTSPYWKKQRERVQRGLPAVSPSRAAGGGLLTKNRVAPPPRASLGANRAAGGNYALPIPAAATNISVKTLLDAVTRVYPAERSPPPPFRTSLRHYQKQTLAFMMEVEEAGASWNMTASAYNLAHETRGGWICSEVGMGKTAIILALVAAKPQKNLQELPKIHGFRRAKATFIMTSVSLMGQWEDECQKHAPHLNVVRFHPASQTTSKTKISENELFQADIIISSATFDWGNHPRINVRNIFFHRVVMDESHLFYARASSAKVDHAREIPAASRYDTKIYVTKLNFDDCLPRPTHTILDFSVPFLSF